MKTANNNIINLVRIVLCVYSKNDHNTIWYRVEKCELHTSFEQIP